MTADAFLRRLRCLVAAWVVVTAAAWPVGCTPEPTPISYSAAQTMADESFQAGANRPPTAKTLYAMAKILAMQGKDPQCEHVLKRTIREYPAFLPAYCDLAELRVRQRRIDDAIQTLQAALAMSPRDPVLLNNLGMCRMLKAEYKEALDLFTQASAAMPQDARYRANMASALGLLGRFDESLALYQQVVSPAEAHYNLGILCQVRKDMDRAAQEFKKAKALATASQAESGTAPPPLPTPGPE
ncbi:MAG: hypothetical protein AMJ81_01495 [Phycisphaerae bacterium SM23_33]|nr:MAG: hypothetical protein AMJ81_01495 [Phycisphaerae bacterium SM23_33]